MWWRSMRATSPRPCWRSCPPCTAAVPRGRAPCCSASALSGCRAGRTAPAAGRPPGPPARSPALPPPQNLSSTALHCLRVPRHHPTVGAALDMYQSQSVPSKPLYCAACTPAHKCNHVVHLWTSCDGAIRGLSSNIATSRHRVLHLVADCQTVSQECMHKVRVEQWVPTWHCCPLQD